MIKFYYSKYEGNENFIDVLLLFGVNSQLRIVFNNDYSLYIEQRSMKTIPVPIGTLFFFVKGY